MTAPEASKAVFPTREKLAAEYVRINGAGRSHATDAEFEHCFKAAWDACTKEHEAIVEVLKKEIFRAQFAEVGAKIDEQFFVGHLRAEVARLREALKNNKEVIKLYRNILEASKLTDGVRALDVILEETNEALNPEPAQWQDDSIHSP